MTLDSLSADWRSATILLMVGYSYYNNSILLSTSVFKSYFSFDDNKIIIYYSRGHTIIVSSNNPICGFKVT